MAAMPESLKAWGSEAFATVFKTEFERFRQDVLPLQAAVDRGNRVIDYDLGVTLMKSSEDEQAIHAKVGVFFAEEIRCVSCGEGDPIDEAYCEMQVSIDKATAEASFELLQA